MPLQPDLDKLDNDEQKLKNSDEPPAELLAFLGQAEEIYLSVGGAKTAPEAVQLCSEALALYRQAQQAAATNPTLLQQARAGLAKVYSQRGHQQRYAGKHAEAIQDLAQGLELEPQLTDDYYYRALSYLKIGNQAAARRDFSEYIKRGEDEYLKRAAWERRESLMPQKEEAVATLEQWRNQGTHFNGEASNALHPSGEDAPDYAAAIALYNKAIEAFDKALEAAPNDKFSKIYKLAALKGQAQCYSQIAEYDLAIADYSQVIQMQSTPQHLFERGEAYRVAGQNELARADFEQATKNGPGLSAANRQQAQKYLTEKPKPANPTTEAQP